MVGHAELPRPTALPGPLQTDILQPTWVPAKLLGQRDEHGCFFVLYRKSGHLSTPGAAGRRDTVAFLPPSGFRRRRSRRWWKLQQLQHFSPFGHAPRRFGCAQTSATTTTAADSTAAATRTTSWYFVRWWYWCQSWGAAKRTLLF